MPKRYRSERAFFGQMLYDLNEANPDPKGRMYTMATIGKQIRAARKAKRMTQSALAAMLNMSRQGVSHWEANRTIPDAHTLLRLSRILDYNFEANMSPEEPEEGSESVIQCRFTLSTAHEGEFPFYPERLVALLRREAQEEALPPLTEECPVPAGAETVDPALLQVQFRTCDPGITGVDCILHGRDSTGNLLSCQTAAELILEDWE